MKTPQKCAKNSWDFKHSLSLLGPVIVIQSYSFWEEGFTVRFLCVPRDSNLSLKKLYSSASNSIVHELGSITSISDVILARVFMSLTHMDWVVLAQNWFFLMVLSSLFLFAVDKLLLQHKQTIKYG